MVTTASVTLFLFFVFFEKTSKNLKKGVDKGKKEWYDSKAVPKKGEQRRTLKIKQCKRKKEHTTRNFKERFKRIRSKRNDKKRRRASKREPKGDLMRRYGARERLIYKLLESLILAQDERWRRA